MANLNGSVGQSGKNIRSDVGLVQQLLNADLPLGKTSLVTDGLVGPKTLAALTEFQRRKGLAPTALVSPGDATWQKLSAGPAALRTLNPQVPVAAPPAGAWPAKF